MNDESPAPASAEGHRERMRARFLAGEEDALSDEALLELLLSYAIPRRDVKPLALALLARFGGIGSVLSAAPSELEQVDGIKGSSVVLLKLADRLRMARDVAPVPIDPPAGDPPDRDEAEQIVRPATEETGAPDPRPEAAGLRESATAPEPPKLQVSNGYVLDTAQSARLITYIAERPNIRRFTRRDLVEGTGLSDRQIESLASMGAAMGLMAPRTQALTPLGKLVARHDLFLDSVVTLEFCHFLAAGNPRNLIWFLVFNDLLANQRPTDQPGWSAWLRAQLAGQYSPRSLVKHIAHEVRFLLDAYTVKNFKKLGLLAETPDKTVALRRYTGLQPLTLAAMIYLVGNRHQARLVPFTDLHAVPGSPGRVFGLDAASVRQMAETLHQKAWIRFEVRHGLDQVRLVEGFGPLEFLAAAYENRAPLPAATTPAPEDERLLL